MSDWGAVYLYFKNRYFDPCPLRSFYNKFAVRIFHSPPSLYIICIITYFYRLILSAVLLTSKFYNDVFYGNHFLAFVGGISLQEMNLLEAEFLKLVNWAIWVAPETEFEMYLAGVIRQYPDQVAPVQAIQPATH